MGDCYVDNGTSVCYVFDGTAWMQLAAPSESREVFVPPTAEQLNKHPTLKQAWEEFIVIKKLLGI